MVKNKKRNFVSFSSNDESDIMDFVDESDSGSEEDSDENVDNLHADEVEADEPESDQASYNVGDFVIVLFENKKFPGRITAIREKGAEVDCMEKRSKSWRWPTKKDCIEYEWGDVIGKIEPPKLCKRNFFLVSDFDEFV